MQSSDDGRGDANKRLESDGGHVEAPPPTNTKSRERRGGGEGSSSTGRKMAGNVQVAESRLTRASQQTRLVSQRRRARRRRTQATVCRQVYKLTQLIVSCLLLAAATSNLLASKTTLAFNIDTQSAIVHSGPQDSYFGYSVALHRDRSVNWLLVGAPKAQTDQPATSHSGAVYKCAASSSRACQQIPFDPNGSSVITLRGERIQSDDKSRQGFGASLQSATENGSIVACAPRYVYYSANLKRRDPVGTCFVSRGSFDGFLEYSPCRVNDQWGHHHLGSCQAGFSSAISRDGAHLFMGAPGAHVWQGQVFAHNLKSDLRNSTSAENPHSEDDSYLGYSLALGRFSAGNSEDVAIGIPRGNYLAGKVMLVDRELRQLRNISGEQVGAYFGYSLATADVNGDQLDDLIIGAPLYYNQTSSHKEPHFDRGRVYVALQNSRHEFRFAQTIDGRKNRGRFGSSLANCGDLNRDGFQDLAVGAPYDGPNEHGAVYIFMGNKFGVSESHDQVIYAEQIRADGDLLRSFGFSLSAGVDVDNNLYPDLLVGDYKADRAILLKTRPVVNVTTSISFQPEHFNLDEKNCLLPNSSTSVSCITVQYCTKYTGVQVDNRLSFVYDIKLDTENKGAPRLFFLNNEGKNEDRNTSTLTKDVNLCKSFKAYILRQIRDKLTPLKIEIDYNLADYVAGQSDQFDYTTNAPKLRPVLNKLATQTNKLSKVATIQKNCGLDNVCVPDLKLTVNPNVDQYVIGSNEHLILDVVVKNYGEDAFESMFYLTMPLSIDYNTINKTRPDYPVCYGPNREQTGANVLTCDLGNPQPRNDVVRFSVIMEPARGGTAATSDDFTFVAQVNSTNPEQDERHREDNQVAIGIPIRVETKLVLSGISSPALIVHNSTTRRQTADNVVVVGTTQQPSNKSWLADFLSKLFGSGDEETLATVADNNSGPATARPLRTEADVGPEVYHNYQLQNKGPSRIEDIAVTILWPSKTTDGEHLLYLVDEPHGDKVVCRPAPDDSINPLGLKYLRGNSVTLATNLAPETVPRKLTKRQAPTSTLAVPSTTGAPTTTVDSSILQQLAPKQSAQFTRFDCNILQLGNNELATIKIRSRLFEETVNKLALQEFDISSRLIAQVKALPYNVSTTSLPPYSHKVETQVHTSGMSIRDLVPWWLIILAILLGILLFALLACFLKYLGFFARKRAPKGAEREPLTPTIWNDYQYSPGDTAL